ncbi:hypothetical protein, partial [Xanthobacter aminoxidans]|uniref:hypothetical protein n=1 Tax=Xanthobacter aminoxidans TaxID=186280 RepID=UPI002022F734
GVEFGYKDRIFEQKYLLPDGLNAFEVQNYLLMSGLRAMAVTGGSGFDSRVLQAAGGTCAGLFVGSQTLPDRTPAQTAIDRTPESQETQSPEELVRRPASNDELCSAQMRLFQVAFTDSMAMDHQLAGLAKSMLARFAGEWVSPSEMADPRMQRAAFSVHSVMTKLYRLAAHGIEVPSDASGGAFEDAAGAIASIRRLLLAAKSDPAGIDRYDARLSAAEDEAAATLAERAARKEAEEKQAREERARAEEEARQAERRQQEAQEALQRARRDRADEIERLEYQRTELDRTVHFYQTRLKYEDKGSDGVRLRGLLNAALTERAEVKRRLMKAKGIAPEQQPQQTPQAPASPLPSPQSEPVAGDDCQQGRTCRVIEVTLFCRTPQQMAAILSQRPGPARRQMLTAFTASGDCRKVGPGSTLAWTAPIAKIQPQGEAEAELVPGTLADGTAGFML